MDRLSHQGMLLIDIASEDRHAAHTDGKCKECLVHGADDDGAVDLGKIRDQVELKTLHRTGKRQAVSGQNDHQEQKCDHHDLGHALQTALQIKAQDNE